MCCTQVGRSTTQNYKQPSSAACCAFALLVYRRWIVLLVWQRLRNQNYINSQCFLKKLRSLHVRVSKESVKKNERFYALGPPIAIPIPCCVGDQGSPKKIHPGGWRFFQTKGWFSMGISIGDLTIPTIESRNIPLS